VAQVQFSYYKICVLKIYIYVLFQGVTLYMDFSYLNRVSLDLDWVIEKIGVFFQYLKGKDIFCYLSSKVLYYLVEKTGELYIYIYPLQGGHLLWLK
jgi:hypothetical protein